MDEVNRALAQLKPSLPADFKHGRAARRRRRPCATPCSDVNISLILGAVLAMVVILLFLHNLRGTLIVSLAIPACIVATFLVMYRREFHAEPDDAAGPLAFGRHSGGRLASSCWKASRGI